MNSHLKFASNLAVETGKMLTGRNGLEKVMPMIKPDMTVVTNSDIDADNKITKAIQEAYPQDAILSEEMNNGLKNVPEGLWVIDPIDGTTNFMLGLHFWGISIAHLKDGMPHIGAVYFPVIDELYTAEAGGGAFLNGEPIQTRPLSPKQPEAFFTRCTRTRKFFKVRLRYKTRVLGSAAYSMCAVARGTAAVGFQATAKIWDIAAGWLILREAGGVADVRVGPQPFPVKPALDFNKIKYPTMMAADQSLADEMYEKITPKPLLIRQREAGLWG